MTRLLAPGETSRASPSKEMAYCFSPLRSSSLPKLLGAIASDGLLVQRPNLNNRAIGAEAFHCIELRLRGSACR